MKIGKYFTYAEMVKSNKARNLVITNKPSEEQIIAFAHLCSNVLDRVREHFDKPMEITSGYRCLELNKAIKSNDSSQHIKGEAADIKIKGVSNLDIANYIKENLDYDQVIAENLLYGDKEAGWVHVSYSINKPNRYNDISLVDGQYINGLVAR